MTCTLALIIAACSSREPPGPPRPGDDDIAPAPAPPSALDAEVSRSPRYDEISRKIDEIRGRQACNRVTGCPGLVDLFQYGPDLVDPAAEALMRRDRGDNYWTIVLPEVLGQTGDPRAAAPLMKLLSDRRWETRIAAAIGLAHLGERAPPEVRTELLRLAALPENEPQAGGDLAFRAALELALMRVDPAAADEHRDVLRSLIPQTKEAVFATPAPILDVLVALVGHARLSSALPGVREALGTGNRFVVATALRVAGELHDSGAIARIIALTEDDNPTIRKTALAVLADITGASFDTPAQWRAWAQRVGLPEIETPPH